MTIIWESDNQTVSDSDAPLPYDYNNYAGTYWLNITTKRQWFGDTTQWTSVDGAVDLTVSRSGVVLKKDGKPDVVLTNEDGKLDVNGIPVNTSQGTLAQLLAQTSEVGSQYYIVDRDNPQLNKLSIYSGRSNQITGETIELKSAQDIPIGYVVEPGIGGAFSCRKCDRSRDVDLVGVVAFKDIVVDEWSTIATNGVYPVAVVAGNYDIADYLVSDNEDGLARAYPFGTRGIFAKVLEQKTISSNGGLIYCLIYPVEHI